MTTNISQVYQAIKDCRAIYISDQQTAHDLPLLKSLNITAVISVANQFKAIYPTEIEHLILPTLDSRHHDFKPFFDQTCNFIERVHTERNVLIHCLNGISASPSIFVAYLIRKQGYTLESALALTRKSRSGANPSPGFIKALEHYSQQNASKHYALSKPQKPRKSSFKRQKSVLQSKSIDHHTTTKRVQFSDSQSPQGKEIDESPQSPQSKSIQTSLLKKLGQEEQQKLKEVLQYKQSVEEKLKRLQSHYHSKKCRQKFNKMKFSSCFVGPSHLSSPPKLGSSQL